VKRAGGKQQIWGKRREGRKSTHLLENISKKRWATRASIVIGKGRGFKGGQPGQRKRECDLSSDGDGLNLVVGGGLLFF